MKKIYLFIFAAFMSAASFAQEPGHHPNRILVTFAEDSPVYQELLNTYGSDLLTQSETLKKVNSNSAPLTSEFFQKHRLSGLQKIALINPSTAAKSVDLLNTSAVRNRMFTVTVEDTDHLSETIQQLRQRTDIEVAEPDFVMKGAGQQASDLFTLEMIDNITPNDPLFNFQWGLHNTGQNINGISGTSGEDINILEGWDLTTGTDEIIMAVLDSGIPDNATDFGSRVIDGYNYVSNISDYSDDHGHGTSVASIAVATGNNSSTIAGVDWNAKILPVKILDSENRGFYSWWINGVYFAMDKEVDVINVSVGGSDVSSSLEQAFTDATDSGIIVIACMMNENNEVTYYPAGYENVIAIGAINNVGDRAVPFSWGGGSNYGEHIDLVAPGNLIASLKYDNPNEGGSFWSGTSQATPMVAGTVSLMLSLNPDLTLSQIRNILTETARGDGSWDKYYGWGKLDAYAALTAVQEQYPVNNEKNVEQPRTFVLNQNYPNPFNPSTKIGFELPHASSISLKVYDMLGREVASLLNKKAFSAGSHTVNFDASGLPSGIYIYQMQAGEFSQTKTMALIK